MQSDSKYYKNARQVTKTISKLNNFPIPKEQLNKIISANKKEASVMTEP